MDGNILNDNPTFQAMGTVEEKKSAKESHVGTSEIGLFRIMVLGMDVETRNVYVQHWIDLDKNKGVICKTDTQIRFMRVYETTALVDETLTLKLQLFDVMRPDHLDMVPETDLVVILLPFSWESSAFRQRTDKFVRTLRKMIDNLTVSQQTFWNKVIVLLEDNFHKMFHHKSLGTFARERTKALAEITDLLTTSLGTKFSRKKKKKKVYIFERDANHMKLKDGIDCRFALCNHITMNVLKAFTKKDLYITWLLKRNIPLPDTYVESALDYCKENEGLNEQEATELWQYLAQRNLLPNAWDKYASTFEDERLDFPIVLPAFSMNPLQNEENFEMEKISFSVDSKNKEFEFKTQFASFEQDMNEFLLSPRKALQDESAFSQTKLTFSKDLSPDFGQKANEMEFESEKQTFFDENKKDDFEMQFESVTESHSVEDTRKKDLDTLEEKANTHKSETQATAAALAEAQAALLAEQEANLKYQAEMAKAELEAKRIEFEKQKQMEEAAKEKAKLEAEKAKAELEAKRIEMEKQALAEESAQAKAKLEAEKAQAELEAKRIEMEKQAKLDEIARNQARMEEELLAAKLANEQKLKEMALMAEQKRAQELEEIKKQLLNDGSNLDDLKKLTEMANKHKSEILQSLEKNAQMMAEAEKNAQEKKNTFEQESSKLQAPNLLAVNEQNDSEAELSELSPEPPDEPLDYEAVESFMKNHKLSNFLEAIIEAGVKHPNNLADMSPPQRRKLADKLGMKSSHRTRFMKACKSYSKSDEYEASKKQDNLRTQQREQESKAKSPSPRPQNGINGGNTSVTTSTGTNNNSNKLSDKIKDVGRRVSASGQQIAQVLMKTFSSNVAPTTGASPYQSSQLQVATNNGNMPPPLQVHRMQPIPDDWIYIGGDFESNILRLLKDRLHNLIKVDNSIRVSLQRLDESTANTKNEVILRFDEIINILNQAKLSALKQCDEFSVQTRDQLIDICTKASIIQDKVSICYNESYAMLHLSPNDFASQSDHTPIKTKFRTYTTQVLQSTMFDVSIPSILLTLHYGNAGIEIPNIEVEANVDNPSQFRDLNVSQLTSPRMGGGFNLYSSPSAQPTLMTPNLPNQQRVNLSNLSNMFNMSVLQSPNQRAYSPPSQGMAGMGQSRYYQQTSQTGQMDGFSLYDTNTGPSMINNFGKSDQFGSEKTHALSLNNSGGAGAGYGAGYGGGYENDSSKFEFSMQKSPTYGQSQAKKKTVQMEMVKEKVEQKQEVKWEYSWYKDSSFGGLAKASYTFEGQNRVSCKGQGLFVADYEIHKDKNMKDIYWEIKIVQAPSLFWVGFIEGPISEIEWEPGEYPPLDGFGIESEYGYWYVGTKYKGLGIGRVVRRADTISFKMNIDEGLCKGDVNNRDCRRTFIRGDLPDCVVPAVLCYQGKGEFIIYGQSDQRSDKKWG